MTVWTGSPGRLETDIMALDDIMESGLQQGQNGLNFSLLIKTFVQCSVDGLRTRTTTSYPTPTPTSAEGTV